MSRKKRKLRRVIRAGLLIFCAILLFLEIFLRLYGLPGFGRRMLEKRLAFGVADCSIGKVKASLFQGFRLQNINISADTGDGIFYFSAKEANCSFHLLEMCAGMILPKSLSIQSAGILFVSGTQQKLIDCQEIFLAARSLDGDKLSGTLSFQQNGIRVKGELLLDHYSFLLASIEALRASRKSPVFPPGNLISLLEKLQNRLAICEFGENDTQFTFLCQGDVLDWKSFRVGGDFDLNYGQVGNLVIHKQRGKFHYAYPKIQCTDLRWLFSSNEFISGNVVFDVQKQTIAADIQGALTPETCMNYASPDAPPLPKELSCPVPIAFRGTLPPAKWDFSNPVASLDCVMKSFAICGTPFQQGNFVLELQRDCLKIRDLVLGLDFRQQKGIRGDFQWNFKKNTFCGNLSANLNLHHILQNLGVLNDGMPMRFEDFDDVKMEITLEESPADWRQWHLHGTFQEQGGQELNLRFQQLNIPFRMENGSFFIQNATAQLQGEDIPPWQFHASMDLKPLKEHAQLLPEFSLKFPTPHGEAGEESDLLSLQGKCILDLAHNTFQLQEGSGSLIPDRAIQGFQKLLDKYGVPQQFLPTGTAPLQLNFQIPVEELDQAHSWKVLFTLQADSCKFRQLEIQQLRADGEFFDGQLTFRGIQARVNEIEEFALDLSFGFHPLAISIQNAVVRGRPESFDAFIFNADASEIYLKIWENVRWDLQQLPEIRIPSLLYWEAPSNPHNWQLKVNADFLLRNATFKEFPIPECTIALNLSLPEEMSLNPIVLKMPEGDIQALAEFSFKGIPSCAFEVKETEAPLDLLLLLKSINEDWQSVLQHFTLPPEARFACQGSFALTNSPGIQIHGKIQTPSLLCKNTELRKVSCDWNLDGACLFWNLPQAELYGAELNNTGWFNFQTKSGETLFQVHDLPLDKVATHFQNPVPAGPQAPLKGIIDCNCKATILNNWANTSWYLEGGGNFSLREADLWKAPTLSNLASVLSLGSLKLFTKDKASSLGNITKLDADFLLQGDKLFVNRFDTDGTIIALHGTGTYDWNQDALQFVVKGDALKNVNFLSMMLKPLSWAFDAELTGSLKEPHWKMRTALNKIFNQ